MAESGGLSVIQGLSFRRHGFNPPVRSVGRFPCSQTEVFISAKDKTLGKLCK
jgi:hypothetical protein